MSKSFRLQWPAEVHRINQYFGENPDFYKPFGLAGHEGLDIYAPMNANIYAAAAGEVYQVGHPANHPYGLHVRIKHVVGNEVYRTIYAHLSQALVTVGQQVKAGDKIGLADNTGNSFGSHLHLTLKLDGAQTPGYTAGIVDPWPYFQATVEDLPPASDLTVYTTDDLSLRAGATTNSTRLAVLPENEPLTVLGDADAARARVGKQGEWLQVRTTGGKNGHVAAWFVRLTGQTPPASSLVVFPTDVLSVRAQPSTSSNRLTIVSPDDALTVLGDADRARTKIGQQDKWLNVKAPSGHAGYVAAWYVHAGDTATTSPGEFLTLTVYPTADLNLRAQPSTNSPRVGGAHFNKPLTVIEDDLAQARREVGQEGQWIYVQTEDGERGWAAAWFLSLEQA
jgi:murein DD-endopeptidase MepM/ murein hydrolase activator NlpD